MDPLSEIISMLHPHACVAAGLDAGGDWSIRFERHAGLKCNAVLKGRCWLCVDGSKPVILEAGDCVILPHGRPFVISSAPAQEGVDAGSVYAPVRHGGTAVYGGGGDFFMASSRFLLSGTIGDMLLRGLPAVLVIRSEPEFAALQWSLNRIAQELREPKPGGALSIEHLAHFVLLQVMRQHLATAPHQTGGWLAAVADPSIARAVSAMHADIARPWTVQDLASRASLSRTSFAVRFRHVTGQTPMQYLAEWRILVAGDRLRRTKVPIARVAAEVGYASESAFSVAFKRITGRSPRQYADDPDARGQDGDRCLVVPERRLAAG
ncbi:AraC family transcriptional regulator [Fertoebacter nigrum]|uniref:AraC family transcriptional regulator n=1 Tax=Fertoeibacter niger TaxID=2656921 RepID=A0A8X8KRB0_9RHOB|nr:AraC family transcriptional regulator [Fertoeibacter niger]NUB45007.1 AraC family transcriptional regulator [Fertoeibacter niger]